MVSLFQLYDFLIYCFITAYTPGPNNLLSMSNAARLGFRRSIPFNFGITAGFFFVSCRQGICFVPIILLLPMFFGLNGILYAQPIADVISAVITVFMAINLHKELAVAEKHILSDNVNTNMTGQ